MFRLNKDVKSITLFLLLHFVLGYWLVMLFTKLLDKIDYIVDLMPKSTLFFMFFIIQEIFILGIMILSIYMNNNSNGEKQTIKELTKDFGKQFFWPKDKSFIVTIFGTYLIMLFCLGIVSYISSLISESLYGLNGVQQSVEMIGKFDFSNTINLLLIGLSIVVIAPIVEEIVYRGFVAKGLIKAYGPYFGLVSSSMIFALIHGETAVVINLFIMGCFLTYVYLKSGSLYYSIIYHMLINGVSFLLLVVGI